MLMALILLGVMGLAAMFSLRLALTGQAVASNRHAHAQALQAAELALRYCEDSIGRPGSLVPVQPAPDVDADLPVRWQTAANWGQTAPLASPVPGALAQGALPLPADAELPQCLVEAMVLRRVRGADDRLGATHPAQH
ncbi:MAG: hypothetical protein EOP93_15720, partial [Lysobacteraceae bacterium]